MRHGATIKTSLVTNEPFFASTAATFVVSPTACEGSPRWSSGRGGVGGHCWFNVQLGESRGNFSCFCFSAPDLHEKGNEFPRRKRRTDWTRTSMWTIDSGHFDKFTVAEETQTLEE